MSEKFVASNRVEISRSGKGVYDHESRRSISMSDGEVDALREFFRHERDEELGRWRWPENPDYVVIQDHADDRYVVVMCESTGLSYGVIEGDRHGDGMPWRGCARDYFAAHPVSKPLPSEPRTAWVDKYGTDIWVVTAAGTLRCVDSPSSDPAKYAPFTQLVKEQSND